MAAPDPHEAHALERLRARAHDFASSLLASHVGPRIDAVFVGGGVARGEVWAAEIDGTLEIYSDVDVYVVVKDEAARRDALVAVRAARTPAEGTVRALRGIEAGVYTREDLAARPVRPGTVGLADDAVWLHGDRGVLASPAGKITARIPRDEALYLLENRATEVAVLAPRTPAENRLARVTALKARLDAGAAHLVADERFATRLAQRAASFSERQPERMGDASRLDFEGALAAARNLVSYFHDEPDAAAAAERALAALHRAWREIAPAVLGVEDGAGQVRVRCGQGMLVANAHEIIRLRSASGWSLVGSLAAAPGFMDFAPRAALRTHAIAERVRAEGEPARAHLQRLRDYVERLTRRLGATD